MFARFALPTRLALALMVACAATVQVRAQGPADGKISGEDLRRALIWTGHYSLMSLDDPEVAFQNAFHGWQRARNYRETKTFPDEQVQELLADGDAKRDSFGWATFEDKSIGFSVGVPTRLVKFLGARNENGGLRYDFTGAVSYTLGVRYGDLSCANINYQMSRVLRGYHATFRARYADGLAVGGRTASETGYLRIMCRTTGVVIAGVDVATSEFDKYGVLLSAMGESLSIARHFNPTATPRPKLDIPAPGPHDLITASAARPAPAAKSGAGVDENGTTSALKRENRTGAELSIEQVFAKVSPAVFVVRADDRLGSAVAVSEHELLTNCHVVKDEPQVSLTLGKDKRTAEIVSRNEKADRCVLRTADKLKTWVSIRPYDDIKVGERALTIGTPQGLDHTVADGIVSSKRTHDNRRLIQTSAPISQGSSGGGLFDAQGHLLGITTFQYKVGQNLNFAIAAEDYAK